jgi:hypothetical protein
MKINTPCNQTFNRSLRVIKYKVVSVELMILLTSIKLSSPNRTNNFTLTRNQPLHLLPPSLRILSYKYTSLEAEGNLKVVS